MALARLKSTPGVQRDGTRLASNYYIDSRWCRFQRGLPRKMGGYQSVTNQLDELVYGMNSFSLNALQYQHLGSASLLGQRRINNSGAQTGFSDRTPGGGFVASADNVWQFDAIYEVGLGDTALVAVAAPNLDISSDTARPVFYGLLSGGGALVDTTMTPVSGGVVTVGNYAVSYGSKGYVQWNSTPNNLTAGTDEAFVTPQKIVQGLSVRGGGVPAALLWSLDSLLVMTLNTGGTPIWDFDTIGEISILSSRGVIEYDGIYYWPGVDRFLSYNGVIREVPNQFNVNFFFDNLNFAQRQKVFGIKVPRYGEIWWCFPKGSSTECNHMVVLNVRENCWYDTPLPNSGRSDGVYAKVYNKPFMTGIDPSGAGYYLWQHETGMDQVIGSGVEPIQSYFETAELSMITNEQEPTDGVLRNPILEPDFVQTGNLTLTVRGRANSRAAIQDSDPITITPQTDIGVVVQEQRAQLKETRRIMSWRFESNTPGGDYQLGHTIAHLDPSGERGTQ